MLTLISVTIDDLEIIAFRQNISQSDLKKLNMKIISHLIPNQT